MSVYGTHPHKQNGAQRLTGPPHPQRTRTLPPFHTLQHLRTPDCESSRRCTVSTACFAEARSGVGSPTNT